MGLGPPVCKACMRLGTITSDDDPRYGIKVSYGNSYYHCPLCGTPELKDNFLECTDAERQRIDPRLNDFYRNLV